MSEKKKKTEPVTVKWDSFSHILNSLKASVYVTDVNTDEIVFMNQAMKNDFGLQSPEGKVCWKVLQQGLTARCDFCPVNALLQNTDRNYEYQWDEVNPVTKREYRNYDCLLEWADGRTVHLQQSIDVTELNASNTDDLTHLYTRKFGKQKLAEHLQQAEAENRPLCVCLYDINMLKALNDTYGHTHGDALITAIAAAVRGQLAEPEFAFRLSGDEFVVVFAGSARDAQRRMEAIRDEVGRKKPEYKMSFCYGFADFVPSHPASVDELLFFADKRMYEQKRQYHIRQNELRLAASPKKHLPGDFDYDATRLYDALVQSTDDYIYVCNMHTGIFKYSAAMVEEFDLPQQVIENAAAVWGAKVHPDDKAAFLEANQEITDGRATAHCVEYRAKNRRGEWVWVRCRGHLEPDENGEPLLFAGFITNLGKKNKIDNLTGLFNKLEFKEQIELLLAQNRPFAFMLLGLDDLKHVNDLYNRTFGDEVIRIASQHIQSLLPAGMTIYRLDGDEFGLIARGASGADMRAVYRSIDQSFEGQQIFDGKKYYCSVSGGCLFCPDHASSYEDLVKYGTYCMEFSKKSGKKRCTFYSQDILDNRTRALTMIELLRESVENHFHGFSLAYQPLVSAKNGAVAGAEALARWTSEALGPVSPMEFIPLLEATGMIGQVGSWVLRTALQAAKPWVEKKPDFVLHVNLSYIQLQDDSFLTRLRGILEAERFCPQNLVLEMTESYFIQVNEHLRAVFSGIRAMGVRIAMDDFGTGYSTLGILKEAPADIVKIDKTFIRDIANSFDATFIRFVVELCHNVGIAVCLEGVETEETYRTVGPMGLDFIQGYLFDRPLAEETFAKKYFF